jgi:SAM-dependent methyltransferase
MGNGSRSQVGKSAVIMQDTIDMTHTGGDRTSLRRPPIFAEQDLKRSIALYRAFKFEQSDPDRFYQLLADDAVRQVSRHVSLEGAVVVDVGGGVGYSTDAFRAAGARCVLVEPEVRALQAGKEGVVSQEAAGTPHWVAVAPGRTVSTGCIIGDGYQLPFRDSTADVSFCSNVLEHIENPQSFISELVRITKPGGIIYISFTNWYSPWGGHETRPWHYLGGEWSARRYRKRTGFDPVHNFGHSLFPVHVGPLLRWAHRWDKVDIAEAVPRYYPSWCNWLVRVPVLRELATWNLLLILRKRPTRDCALQRGGQVAPSNKSGALSRNVEQSGREEDGG